MFALAGLAVLPASASAGQTQTCTKSGAIATGNPTYDVENSDSTGGSTCLTVSSSGTSFRVDSSSYDSSDGVPQDQQFTAFTSIFTGCKQVGCLEPNYPAQASRVTHEYTSWSFNFNSSGKYDAVYDMFFNKTPSVQFAPTGAELMVWLNHHNVDLSGPQLPDVTIEGTLWHVFSIYKTTPVGSWNRIAFERADPTSSVSNLDIAPFIQAAMTDGAIVPNWYEQALEGGFELWYGGVGLTTYSFSADPPVLAPESSAGSGSGTSESGSGSSGSNGKGGKSANSKTTRRPNVSLSLPECYLHMTKKRCAALRRTAGVWRHIVGMASGDAKVKKVTVTAYRARHGRAKKKTIRVKAKFVSTTAWKATLNGLTKGRWRFTAVAADVDGNQRTSKPIYASLNVGLPAR